MSRESVFTVLGLIVLICVPTLGLTVSNLIIFVVGAFPGTLALGYAYGRLFADPRNQLNSKAAVLGFFSVMLGATVGGAVFVWLRMCGSAQEFVEARILGGFLKNDEFGEAIELKSFITTGAFFSSSLLIIRIDRCDRLLRSGSRISRPLCGTPRNCRVTERGSSGVFSVSSVTKNQ